MRWAIYEFQGGIGLWFGTLVASKWPRMADQAPAEAILHKAQVCRCMAVMLRSGQQCIVTLCRVDCDRRIVGMKKYIGGTLDAWVSSVGA